MFKMFKKIFSLILCLCIIFSLVSMNASAMEIREGTITVDTVSALPGEIAVVSLNITENPGIMASVITITYDKSALIYEDYYKGEVFKSYTVNCNAESGIIRFVSSSFSNVYGDGKLISFKFKIKDDAKMGKYKVRITSTKGDFSNSNEDTIIPETVLGGVNVEYNGENCPHRKYTEWETTGLPSCEGAGLQQRYCTYCSHVQNREIAPLGHDYEDKWTVDIPAVQGQDGVISRHCTRCTSVTEILTFSYNQAVEENIENSINSNVPSSDFTQQLLEEQKPQNDTNNTDAAADNKVYYVEEAVPEGFFARLKYNLYEKNGMGTVGKITEIIPNFEKLFSYAPLFLGILTHFLIFTI